MQGGIRDTENPVADLSPEHRYDKLVGFVEALKTLGQRGRPRRVSRMSPLGGGSKLFASRSFPRLPIETIGTSSAVD
jgi:hypothetical protein